MSSSHPGFPRLLGDIGGTNARFAWQAAPDAAFDDIRTLPCADFPTLEAAMRAYLGERRAAQCAFGIANPVTGDEVRMTNHHWAFSIEALRLAMGFERLVVVNDFTALALALPALPRGHLRAVGGGAPVADAAVALIGAGTGLGVSGLLPSGRPGVWLPIAGEGGHVTVAAETPREFAVLQALQRRHGHVSAERVVSGQGLENLYSALREIDGRPEAGASAAQVSEQALAGADAHAVEALTLFCAFLGSATGNLALTLGARGGVYIGGGIVPRLGTWFDASPFRARFEAKGRFAGYLAAMPTWVIDAPSSPALLGASRAFDLP